MHVQDEAILELGTYPPFNTKPDQKLAIRPLTLLAGPNGTGKSRLMQAVRWALYDEHTAHIHKLSPLQTNMERHWRLRLSQDFDSRHGRPKRAWTSQLHIPAWRPPPE